MRFFVFFCLNFPPYVCTVIVSPVPNNKTQHMKAFISTLRISLLAVLLCTTTVHAQWNTLNHDATVNRSISDIFFVSSTGYAAGWRADAVSWGTRGLLYKTTDGGQTWSTIMVPLVVGTDSVQGLKSIHFTSPNTGYAATICYSTNNVSGIYYGALLKTTDGGQTWTSLYSMKNQINWSNGNTTHFDHITFSDQYTGFISGWRNLGVNTYDGLTFTTYNGGNSWVQNTAFTGTGTQAHASYFESNGTGSVAGGKPMGLSGPYNGRIARSTNWGNTWNVTFIDNDYAYVDIHFPVAQVGYAVGDSMYFTTAGASNGKLVKTTNGGISWSQQALFTNFKPLCVFFTSATEGYIGGETAAGNAAIRKTTDGGVTWTNEVYPDIATASLVTSIHFSTPVTGYATNSWTNSNSVYGAFLSSTCAVFAGPDTSFCQAAGQIFATPGTPGNDYVYSWSPATGLSDPNAQAPFVSQVSNQQYVVTMTDTVTSCTATDTIVVSAYSASFGPEYFCTGDSVLLDLGPGGTNYNWQMFTDTNNVTTFLNATTQTLWADEPGYYLAYATFPGCGTLTSNIQVIDSCTTSSNCWNLFTYQHNPYTCGDSVLFVGTGSGSVTSWTWDMGDGNVYSGPTLSTLYHNYTAGTYTVTLTTINNTNCTAVTSLVVTVTAGVNVNAGPDSVYCGQPVQLAATPQASGSYTYSWSPANLLQNPASQTPFGFYGDHLNNQPFIVTMTDAATGCTATDTVIASSYWPVLTNPVYICPGDSVLLDFGPGASIYLWQFYYDTAGNQVPLNVTMQTLWIDEPGMYVGYANFPGCGNITSNIQAIDSCTTSSNCWNIMTYQHNPYTCGDSVLFIGTGSGSVVSWTWDMGDGNVYSGPALSMLYHNYTAGTYTVTLTTVDNTNCTAVSSLIITVTAGVGVSAGADTTFCQQQGQLNAIPFTPGSYTFSWSPANGLDDPNIQNPNVISGVSSQQYVVTMTDTATGCTATDTVIVSAYYFSNDTVYICDSSYVTLDLGPGASNYYWQHYLDTAGNLFPINVTTQTLSVNQPGQYLAFASFPGCGTLTNLFYVVDSCNVYVSDVWPGDCNYDLVANMADALHIGLGYGATDATRPNATPSWYPQPMTDWAQSFTNCNYKHADADGDGVINVNDTLPISLNYGNTHPFRLGQPEFIASAPTLTLIANYDTVGLQTLVTIDVQLGSAALPVDSLYGISFRITADAGLIDTTLTVINLNTTWLGTMGGNMFGFRKAFPGGGRIDVAESRNDHLNRLNGSGTIATFSIVTTDNLSGIAICHIDVTEVTAVTASQHYLAINVVNDSVVINPAAPAGIEEPGAETGFTAYPNPANEQVTVQTGKTASRIEICDMLGRTVQWASPASTTTVFNTSALADGVYLIRVYSGSSVTTQKLTVTR